MTKRIGFIFILCLLSASCKQGSIIDEETGVAIETVALDQDEVRESYIPTLEGPLRVLSASPNGISPLEANQAISITFSKPMVPLGATEPAAPNLISVSPPIDGVLQWEGTQTLVLRPLTPPPAATAYEVRVAEGITALDGDVLAEAVIWNFETPRPRLISSNPSAGSYQADPNQAIELVFNQPVRTENITSLVTIKKTTGNQEVDFSFQWSSDSLLLLQPIEPLEKNQYYSLSLPTGLQGNEGPLRSDPIELGFSVYPNLTVQRVFQPVNYYEEITDNFDPAQGITIAFSTPVSFGALRQALSFSPMLEWPAGIEARDQLVSTTHRLPFLWGPQQRYTLTISNLSDTYGQVLDQATLTFNTQSYKPALHMPEGLMVIEADQQPALALRATNVSGLSYGIQRINPDQIVPAISAYYRGYYGGDGPSLSPIEANETMSLSLTADKPQVVPFSMEQGLVNGTGVIGFQAVSLPGELPASANFRGLAQVTRLGLTAKYSPHQNLVWVTDLQSGSPVAGARVTIRDEQNNLKWEGFTDDEGTALSPGWAVLGISSSDEWSRPRQFVIVEHEGDVAFSGSDIGSGLEPYRFGVRYDWNPPDQTITGTVFSDRGLYRAGDQVFIKGILRQKTDGDWEHFRDSVRVLIYSPREELVLDRAYRISDMGSFHLDWQSRASAALGSYQVRIVRTDDEEATQREFWESGDLATGQFRLDAFRNATFAVEQLTSANSYTAGDFLDATVSGRYLFGSAMQNQPVYYSIYRQAGSYTPPGFSSYVFGDYGSNLYQLLSSEDTQLDDAGQLAIRTPLPGNEEGAVGRIVFEATVSDPSRQQTSARKELVLHPGLFYLGLRPETTFLDLSEQTSMPVQLIAVTPDGASVTASNVSVRLVKRQWNSIREVGSDGRLRWRSEMIEDEKLVQKLSVDAGTARRLSLPVEEGGSYFIEAKGTDLRGNTIATKAYFYATGGGYVAWARSDDDRIELTPERSDYRPGETATIMVQSPFEEAQALITIEREGIISSRVETLVGSAPKIEIPLSDAHMPNIFVSVMLLSGRTAPPSGIFDAGAPSFKMGYTTLNVDPGQRHASVEVLPDKQEYRPGETVEVNLRLVNAEGQGTPGEITFSAADAGVLNLINYALPDPFQTFYGPRSLGVNTSQTLAHLVRQRSFGQKEEDEGGGGGMDDNASIRADFRPLAHWDPAIRTDQQGRATITFTLPESLTTFRLMATAHTSSQDFGAGSADIIVTKPLVMVPALPRFARLDDTFEAGVLVTNRTDESGEVTVSVAENHPALQGSSEKTIVLAPGETQEVRFTWSIAGLDLPAFTFEARLGNESDALQLNVPVQLPTTKITSATFASTDDVSQEALQLPAGILTERGAFTGSLSSTALVGLDGATRYLFEYPYGCLEQRTSRIRPLIVGNELLENFGLTPLDGARDSLVVDWIETLSDFWTGNGFSLWQGGSYVNPFTSAYVVLGMAEAETAGYIIPTELKNAALGYLETSVRNQSSKPSFYSAQAWNDTRALMLYALALHDRILEGEVDALATAFLGSAATLGPAGQSYLLRTLNRTAQPALQRMAPAFVDQFMRQLRVEPTSAYLAVREDNSNYWIFASNTRETALGLTALLDANPPVEVVPLLQKMVRYLINSRQSGHWASTQENIAVVEALARYHEVLESEDPDFTAEIRVAGQVLLENTFSGRTLAAPTANLPVSALATSGNVPVEIQKSGTGTAYYSLILETYSTEAVEPLNQGLQIQRLVQQLDQAGLPQGPVYNTGTDTLHVEAGQLLRVTLRLQSAADRNYVVVDDALPAGLETVNAAFSGTQEALQEQTGSDQWWGSFNHTEMRDDRVLLFADYLTRGEHTYTYVARATTSGTYVHPPVQSELMYQPEVNGRNGTGTLIVRPAAEPLAQNP